MCLNVRCVACGFGMLLCPMSVNQNFSIVALGGGFTAFTLVYVIKTTKHLIVPKPMFSQSEVVLLSDLEDLGG